MRASLPVPLRGSGLAALVLLLAGCGGTGDIGVGVGGGETGIDDGLGGDTGTATAPFLIMDPSSGATRTAAALDDLATGSAYRSSSMVFRRVRSASGEFWMGCFEVTQAQWQALAGSSSTPWSDVPAAVFASGQDAAAAIADDRPAFNLSYDTVSTVVTAFNQAHGCHLAMPTDAQWTEACVGGGSAGALWSWGDGTDLTTVATSAVVRETLAGLTGPRPVGGRAANAAGFFDMHGNVWELTAPQGVLRGGSWYDPVLQARTENRPGTSETGITPDTAHALVGVRLVVLP